MAQGSEQGYVGADGRFHDQVFGRPDDELVERGRSMARRVGWFCHICQGEAGKCQHGCWMKFPGSGEEKLNSFLGHAGSQNFSISLSLIHVFCDLLTTNHERWTNYISYARKSCRDRNQSLDTRFYLRYSLSSMGYVFSNFFPSNYNKLGARVQRDEWVDCISLCFLKYIDLLHLYSNLKTLGFWFCNWFFCFSK